MERNDMMDEQDKNLAIGSTVSSAQQDCGTSPVISRRMLLRGATAAVPTILTLQSGSALANSSSGTITPNENTPSQGEYGGTPCLNAASTDGMAGKSGKYKLGDPPIAEVNVIPDGVEFYSQPDGTGPLMTPREMCYKYQYPGPYYHHNGTEFVPVNVPQGGLVSAAALASFANASGVVIKYITNT